VYRCAGAPGSEDRREFDLRDVRGTSSRGPNMERTGAHTHR
jgi:hypothetical protein